MRCALLLLVIDYVGWIVICLVSMVGVLFVLYLFVCFIVN